MNSFPPLIDTLFDSWFLLANRPLPEPNAVPQGHPFAQERPFSLAHASSGHFIKTSVKNFKISGYHRSLEVVVYLRVGFIPQCIP